jgi:hypothetical protein
MVSFFLILKRKMSLASFPSDLLIKIGLYCDWETIYRCYRFLNKRLYRLCQNNFWQQKYRRDCSIFADQSTFYPNFFYHYLAERSRRLMNEIDKFKKAPWKTTTYTIIWHRIFQIELKRIQEILYPYLRFKYPNYFRYYVIEPNVKIKVSKNASLGKRSL